ncbi:guanine nucleotide-binding protein subunit gamma 2 [Euphorbia lathyris]|uniref:guanine nucleotide-binding protein subunit gamma 2 n=1 Tax=Euphorbia lathyris TaxID=212925 RepID=UPI0033130D4E
MQSDRSDSSGSIAQRVNSLQSDTDTRGKHRIQAELKRLDQETRYLQEELEQLDKIEMASAACKEMLGVVEIRPDPLLPVTHGPLNPLWDRWFESAQDSQGCRCWML